MPGVFFNAGHLCSTVTKPQKCRSPALKKMPGFNAERTLPSGPA
jgi:hypothetical protein